MDNDPKNSKEQGSKDQDKEGLEEKTANSAEVKPSNDDSKASPSLAAPVLPPGPPDEKGWYVLRVQSGKEDYVKATLEKRVEASSVQSQIFKVLVPTELVAEIRKGFKRVVERKLYPGYVMVEMMFNEDTHYFLRNISGVGEVAGKMSESEVERILLTCGHTKDKPKPKVSFQKGQSIKIKEGAFENYDGIVDEVNEQKGIVKVRIEIFGRYTQVELGYWQVESV